jgi:uncharacterized protein YdaU (DUF1376 family)
MANSPAFQFYPKDYLGDKNTIPMTTLEHGAYFLLLLHCWEEDGLPGDLGDLADMARLSVEDFTSMWGRRLKKCFVWNDKKNVYENPRLLKEIKKQKAWKKKKSDAGKQGADKRWHQTGNGDGTAMALPSTAMANDSSSSSSLSSSSSVSSVEESAHTGRILSGLLLNLGLEKFTPTEEREWTQHADLAFRNRFTADEFLEYHAERVRTGKGYRIKPDYITEGLSAFVQSKKARRVETLPSLDQLIADREANDEAARRMHEVERVQ